MIIKIDWISFTLMLPSGVAGASLDACNYVETVLRTYFPEDLANSLLDAKFALSGGRAPYQYRYTREDNFASVFWGDNVRSLLVELSGGGCDKLERQGLLLAYLAHVEPRLTRLDIAVDMPVHFKPLEFLAAGVSDRFKARSFVTSDTGETAYVGSRESERYARVYRYNPPHPRSEYLRCEFVLKHENAKTTARKLADVGIAQTGALLGNSFGWKHPAWKPEFLTDQTLPGWKPERRQGATVRWLLTSVFPAMARLVKEGVIDDLDTFLDQHLYSLVGGEGDELTAI